WILEPDELASGSGRGADVFGGVGRVLGVVHGEGVWGGRMKRLGWAGIVALTAIVCAWPAAAQDLQTQLAYFLVDLRNGAWGTTVTPSSVTLSNTSGLGTTSTNGVIVKNGTAATVGTTVQISPRVLLRGNGWDSDDTVSRTVDFAMEALPATGTTVTGTWKLGYQLDGAAITYPLTVSSAGSLTTLSTVIAGSHVIVAAGASHGWTGRTNLSSSADKLLSVLDNGLTTGAEMSVGTPTLGTCTA